MRQGKIKHYRWIIAGMLFLATCINYLDRQIIGLLKPVLEKEFNWTETDFSHIVMAFTGAYAVGLLVSGRFIDRVGTKIGYALTVIVWSLAGMFHALAKTVGGFIIARIGLGIGEAGNFPAAVKAVAEWFPKKERGLATGIFNSGTAVGVIFALLITPPVLRNYNWQGVFLITGALGFLWLICWWILYSLPAQQKRLSDSEKELILKDHQVQSEKEQKLIPWKNLFGYPQTWAFITGKLLIDPIFWFFLFWLPSYFSSTFKLDLTKLSPELMIIYSATTIGSIGGGYLSGVLVKRGWQPVKARKTVLLLFAVIELSILSAQFISEVWTAVALISLVVAVHQAWATNIFTLASDMFPKETVSSVAGIGGMAGAVGGIFFPLLVGKILDTYKAAGNLQGGYNVIFTICGCTYLLAWVIIHLLTKKAKEI